MRKFKIEYWKRFNDGDKDFFVIDVEAENEEEAINLVKRRAGVITSSVRIIK